ncbi:GNAT family N-acetyltransferase [Xanthobacter sp. KR7-225]|uniref:GNAT family N-acetyltransferase n=1 Tax=Xanthobacter sp. KR7-225 TaxID=3156613 RepID=UPI0032B57E74
MPGTAPRADPAAGRPGELRLEPVGPANRAAVLALELADDQRDLLADNASSLKEARRDRAARPRAVVAGDRVVGFAMYDAGDAGEALIYRFMIDRRAQGRGYGRAALAALVREIAAIEGVRDIRVCYMPDNEGARRLYRSAGFVDEGEDEDGEMIARLSVVPRPRAGQP